jgi:hypothetical protein
MAALIHVCVVLIAGLRIRHHDFFRILIRIRLLRTFRLQLRNRILFRILHERESRIKLALYSEITTIYTFV